MDPLDLLPLGLTCALSLSAWLVALRLDRRVASTEREPSGDEAVPEVRFLH